MSSKSEFEYGDKTETAKDQQQNKICHVRSSMLVIMTSKHELFIFIQFLKKEWGKDFVRENSTYL